MKKLSDKNAKCEAFVCEKIRTDFKINNLMCFENMGLMHIIIKHGIYISLKTPTT